MQRTIEESRMSSAAVPSPREARAANGAGSWEFMETVWKGSPNGAKSDNEVRHTLYSMPISSVRQFVDFSE